MDRRTFEQFNTGEAHAAAPALPSPKSRGTRAMLAMQLASLPLSLVATAERLTWQRQHHADHPPALLAEAVARALAERADAQAVRA